jgi:uncharacterized protein (DUF58 family)
VTPTDAAVRGAVLAIGLVATGLAIGRPDLVALAAPFIVVLLLSIGTRAGATPELTLHTSTARLRETEVMAAEVTVVPDANVDVIVVELTATGVSVLGSRRTVTALTARTPTTVGFRCRADRWGRHRIGPVVWQRFGPVSLTRSARSTVHSVDVSVLPATESFDAADAVPRAVAYAGNHRSRATGSGIEFVGVRPFTSGDTPRRINWRTTARTGALHVNTTLSDRSALVLILIDSRHDAGSGGDTILNAAVHAAAGIADHYLGLGDAVGLVEYGGHNRRLQPASGQQQLARTLDWLVDVRTPMSVAPPSARMLLNSIPVSRAIVLALTPILDDEAAARLLTLRRRGAAIVTIDTLPDGALPKPVDLAGEVALRLWRLERQGLIHRLGDLGVPVARWAGPGTLDAVLGDLGRVANAARAVNG